MFSRSSISSLVLLLLVLSNVRVAPGADQARLTIDKPPYLVGQVISLELSLIAGSRRPEIQPPLIDGLRISEAGTALQALTTDSIGHVINERIRYRYYYRVVPTRAGLFWLEPFRFFEAGNPTAASTRISLEVIAPPAGPATFLGGIGPLTVKAEVLPPSIRVTQPVEYRIRLEGPGAVGSRLPPDLDRIRLLPSKPEVEWKGSEVAADPPVRIHRYAVKPNLPGPLKLPPVLISWYDPVARRFQTTPGDSVELQVNAAPPLRSDQVLYDDTEAQDDFPGPRQVPGSLVQGLLDIRLLLALAVILPALLLAVSYHLSKSRQTQFRAMLRDALQQAETSPTDHLRDWQEGTRLLELTLNSRARHIPIRSVRTCGEADSKRPPGTSAWPGD